MPQSRGFSPDPSPGPTQSAAPPKRAGREQLSGELVLEGELIGRWIIDRMAREAGRPPAGAAGFDTRLSPAWTSGPL